MPDPTSNVGVPKAIHCSDCGREDVTHLSQIEAFDRSRQEHYYNDDCDGDVELRYEDADDDPRSGKMAPDYDAAPPGQRQRVMTDGGRVGPIIFNHERARRYLIDNGQVVTFRKEQRSIGETHVRFERTGSKQFDCKVQLLADVAHDELDRAIEEHYGAAGFSSAAEWRQAIRELNGEFPDEGCLYQVFACGRYLEQMGVATDA